MFVDVNVKSLVLDEVGVVQGFDLSEVELHLRDLLLLNHEKLDCVLGTSFLPDTTVKKSIGTLPYFLLQLEFLLEVVGTG